MHVYHHEHNEYMRLLALIVLSMLFILMAELGYSQDLPFTHYTKDNELNPLPSADVRTIYQDRLGYIWMVIYSSGLVRYDGHKLDHYIVEDGLPDLTVRQVLEDRFGRLWVGSNAGLVVSEKPLNEYGSNSRIHFTSTIGTTQLVNTTIIENRIAVDSSGVIWVGTREHGIIRYRCSDLSSAVVDTVTTDIYSEKKNKDIRSITVRKNGAVWVGIGGGDLLIFKTNSHKFEVLNEKDKIPRENTDVLFESRYGILWGGCRTGLLWRLIEGTGQYNIEVVSEYFKDRISSITDEKGGTLWVASGGSGVMKLMYEREDIPRNTTPSLRVIYSKKNGLLNDNVSNILQDREGNIWFAQSGGVSKLRANYPAFITYSATSHVGEKPFLPNPEINAVIVTNKILQSPAIIIGSSGGGVTFIKDDGNVETIQSDRGLRHNYVNSLTIDEKERLWIGSLAGINCVSFDPKVPPPYSRLVQNITLFNKKAVVANYRNNTIYVCKALPLVISSSEAKTVESLWFPGYQSIYCLVENQWFVFRATSGLPSTFFNTVAFDGEGKLWVGTRDGGLFRSTISITLLQLQELKSQDVEFQLGSGGGKFGREIIASIFEPVCNKSKGFPSNQIETMLWRDGALWVGTFEGLVVLEGSPLKMTTHLTINDGLKANNITSMMFSPVTGSLWVGTNGGLAEIDPKSRKIIRVVTKQDGLVDNEVWASGSVFLKENGAVYFGTAKGLSVYKPDLDKSNSVLPILRLNQASLKEELSSNEIVFEYAALSFANEKLVRYRTRLVGYDEDWSEEKSEVQIRYTNLAAFLFPNKYTFEIIASNDDGVWTEKSLAYMFSVQPPWWFRWWSMLSFLIIVGAGANVVHRHRVKGLEKRSQELEKTVEQRTHEVNQKADKIRLQADQLASSNKELEQKNQEIIKTQEQLIIQEKLASLGSLTAGIAHEIKNPLNFVNNFSALSIDLTKELRNEIKQQKDKLDLKNAQVVEEILNDLEQNVQKINEHGKRADSIVKGMLSHSSGKAGEKELTDINALLAEHVNLAYHGLRAADRSFNVKIESSYDQTIGLVNVFPQNLSRAFINIVNNGCYAANEKRKVQGDTFSPTLQVSTKNLGEKVEIRIRDNGIGIPKNILEKIFNPFFTTKPTGMGTGLGLSLTFDIIVREHNGDIKVDTKEGEFAEFIIALPKG